jgi:hypothetical protein
MFILSMMTSLEPLFQRRICCGTAGSYVATVPKFIADGVTTSDCPATSGVNVNLVLGINALNVPVPGLFKFIGFVGFVVGPDKDLF